jgi:hypothetical protein
MRQNAAGFTTIVNATLSSVHLDNELSSAYAGGYFMRTYG